MKPVSKGAKAGPFSQHSKAKPDLINRIGAFCSYCEAPTGRIQNLHVEHIYSQIAHPKLATNWSNFLLACISCNNSKRRHLGDGVLTHLKKRCYWPHLDNTYNVFEYLEDGQVNIRNGEDAKARELMDMAGLMKSPASAAPYEELGLAYDGITTRKEAWGIASNAKALYGQHRSREVEETIVNLAIKTGYFSIWMTVFDDLPDMKQLFIAAFKADPNCFDHATTLPMLKGRI